MTTDLLLLIVWAIAFSAGFVAGALWVARKADA